jgi:predicted transcriptional regulator
MMRNITFSAEDQLIDKAREIATREERTLNDVFREWLASYVGRDDAVEQYRELMSRLSYVRAGRKFTREEMNERR